jgi:hypothetical protein
LFEVVSEVLEGDTEDFPDPEFVGFKRASRSNKKSYYARIAE